MHRIGLIINPFAGIGGRAGLKGSDGAEIQQQAREKGYESLAPVRVSEALKQLKNVKDGVEIVTYPHEMGEDVAREAGFPTIVLGEIESGKTTADDTIRAARDMEEAGVEVIIFAGGDGTARNICTAVEQRIPTLGIPCGVKMHSSCYAINPRRAGDIAKSYLERPVRQTTEGEVMDIDEEAFRKGDVQARLYGYLTVPEAGVFMQKPKGGSGYSQASQVTGLGALFADRMEPGVLYIVGPGSTTTYVMKDLDLPYTLLGVDLVVDRQLVASDVDEATIWEWLQKYDRAVIILTVIGGQGLLFGRGNQQFSPRIIRRVGKENLWIIASKQKLIDLSPNPFLVDTGDPELDEELCGYILVPQGTSESMPWKVSM